MTTNEIFNKLFNGGSFSLPYLLHFHSTDNDIYLINDNRSVTYNNHEYLISSFDYVQADAEGNGASLNIKADDSNALFEFVENGDSSCYLEVVGVITENNNIQPLNFFMHFLGNVSVGDDNSIEFNLLPDERIELQFCPYVFDTDNNGGNA